MRRDSLVEAIWQTRGLYCCAAVFHGLFGGWRGNSGSSRPSSPMMGGGSRRAFGPALLPAGILVAALVGFSIYYTSGPMTPDVPLGGEVAMGARQERSLDARNPPYYSQASHAVGAPGVAEGEESVVNTTHMEEVIHPSSPHAHKFAITEKERKAGLQAHKDLVAHCSANSGDPMCIKPDAKRLDLTQSSTGYICLAVFALCYGCVIFEEFFGHGFRKSIPMTVCSGFLWTLVAWTYKTEAPGQAENVAASLRHNLLEFVEVFMFLLVAMTFINTMECLNVFAVVERRLVEKGYSIRAMFWITGALAFVLSPIADNLTTALLMGAVVVAVGHDNEAFISVSCVNIVVAANAGGAFSPFGDITTLMVWQKGKLEIEEFLALFLPSLVNWLVPAVIMSWAIKPSGGGVSKAKSDEGPVNMLPGAIEVMTIFICTVIMSAVMHGSFHLPPVLGMMTGLGVLQLYGFLAGQKMAKSGGHGLDGLSRDKAAQVDALDIFKRLEKTEWDTLLFFYGVIMSVGLLGLVGYLDLVAQYAYGELGANVANVIVGVLSAVVDNIPVMFAVLSTDPPMSQNDWLLCTLTAGTGGSMLAVGSAYLDKAGVGLMGVARGRYNFWTHLQWTWAVALGYVASIAVHFAVNGME